MVIDAQVSNKANRTLVKGYDFFLYYQVFSFYTKIKSTEMLSYNDFSHIYNIVWEKKVIGMMHA